MLSSSVRIRLRSALASCGILVWIFVVFGFCFLLHVSYSLVQQDQRCIKGVAGKRYTFDLEYYTKVSIYAIWKEIGYCLDMKQKMLVEYIINETNLGKNGNTVRKYL